MKKILFNLLILITSSLFYSCSIYNADNYLPQENVFIPSFNKNEAILRFEGREYYFNLESLFHKYIQNNESVKLSFPIVNKNLDSINVNNILLSDLKLWERKLKYFSNRYLKGESSIVFTVPGKIIVSLINKNTLKKINIKKDRTSTRLNSSHIQKSRMPSSA